MKSPRLPQILATFLLATAFGGFFSGIAWSTPSAEVFFSETDLGGGLWRYDYALSNTSDPVIDAGFDIFDFFLSFDTVELSDLSAPADWDFISDSSSFIDWFSLLPGPPPSGADVAPGTSLPGFSFTSNMQISSSYFEVLYTDGAAPIPEPSALLLVCSGLVGLGFLGSLRKVRI